MKNTKINTYSIIVIITTVIGCALVWSLVLIGANLDTPTTEKNFDFNSNFRIIFQNENEVGSVRVETGTCANSPEGTLIVDSQGEGWLVSDKLEEGAKVMMMITDNNTDEYNDDSIITLIEVVQ